MLKLPRINEDTLKGERAEYGKEILATLSRELIRDYGASFGEKNLRDRKDLGQNQKDFFVMAGSPNAITWK